jgi:hypothetical protein
MVTEYTKSGYVIIPPTNTWDDKSKVIPDMAYRTFGQTPTEAWIKHMGTTEWDGVKVNKWIDKGYRLKEATLTILVDNNIQL